MFSGCHKSFVGKCASARVRGSQPDIAFQGKERCAMSRTRRVLTPAVLLTVVFSIGCSHTPTTVQPVSSTTETPVKPAPSATDAQIESLQTRIRQLQQDLGKVQARASRYDSVSLDPTEKGYERIDTSSGFFLISVKSAEPYLDGYRLHLQIGNPTAARYTGFKLTVTWEKPFPQQKEGESEQDFSKRQEAWLQEPPREKEFSFTEIIYPASWNTVSLVVSPATAEEVKTLSITSMETREVGLAVR